MGDAAHTAPAYPWLASYPPGVDWAMQIPVRPLTALLDEAVAANGDRTCLNFLGKRTSYREVGRLVDAAAHGFQQLGVGKGSRVGLFLPNTPYYVICFFAILKAGGTVVNFNPLYAERELVHQIGDSDIDLMVTLDLKLLYGKMARMLAETGLKRLVVCSMADILPFPKNWLFPIAKRAEIAAIPRDDRHIPFARLIAGGARPEPVAIDAREDVAVLQYTGGTTGVPKGAMLTHANLHANTIQCATWYAAKERRPGEGAADGPGDGQERMLGVLPLFHVFAMTAVMNFGLHLGAEIVLLPRFELEQVMRTLQKERITLFPAVPTIYTAINHHKRLKDFDLSSIRFCMSGGAPLPLEVKEAFERTTGCTLVEGYGLSESSPVATVNPVVLHADKKGSIGLPLPGTVIEIVSLEEPRRVLAPGEKGEVCIRGPQVMKGYWRRPAETAQTLVDGRLHTGDVGVMDEDGYTTIVDRIKDMILCSGFNVYPRNVEEAIYLHPAVAECVVAGLPDEYRGQTVKAYVRLSEGQSLTAEELTAFLKDKLSPIEMPKVVEFRAELPKTMIGKLSRKALVDEEERKRTAAVQQAVVRDGAQGSGRDSGRESGRGAA
ncbi:long-chain-fatty-acid--CoA ligase [Azospirillum picis]|uniref:Long-chain acyl-CoA synthetase n=1 Tax=Azospirillum picis TaxID=488438 RepID=A0ABU0MKH7_9PROT|nr:long-chain fatty acid--CoA ligase [Azospirillum picis]MBP2300061.1 long-chain acyl-CoA synthetase [Azospirillum picis]MDQ0533701.1 long-chain acyl-CoA synthetase [Azospirillum picis]